MKVLVISPTYNENKNISELINRISHISKTIDILIIDDNSPDGTAGIVKDAMKSNANIHLIERECKLGLGTAYCKGFKYALQNGYERIVQMDADLSHNPNDILRLLESANSYDMVIGSRYIDGVNVINWPINRLLLSYFANWYARLMTGVPIMDLTGGYKCFRSEVFEQIDLKKINSEGYSFQIEMNFLLYNKGFKITEIPIIFTDRTVGESKMSRKIIYEAIFIVWRLKFRKLFGRI